MARWIPTSAALSMLLLGAACEPRTEFVATAVPTELLTPPDRPALPGPGATSTDAAVFLVDQAAALDQCIGQIESIAEIVSATERLSDQ